MQQTNTKKKSGGQPHVTRTLLQNTNWFTWTPYVLLATKSAVRSTSDQYRIRNRHQLKKQRKRKDRLQDERGWSFKRNSVQHIRTELDFGETLTQHTLYAKNNLFSCRELRCGPAALLICCDTHLANVTYPPYCCFVCLTSFFLAYSLLVSERHN